MRINVVLADAHPTSIAGVTAALHPVETIQVTGTATNASEVIDLLSSVPCDVVVADYALPGGAHEGGTALLSRLRDRFPNVKIVVFTTVDHPAVVRALARIGVHSYISKSDNLIELISAIHDVAAVSDAPSAAWLSKNLVPPQLHCETVRRMDLSQRELEVVRLFISGESVGEIAKRLNRRKQTISTQKRAAMRKLGVVRDVDLLFYASEIGLDCVTPFSGQSNERPP